MTKKKDNFQVDFFIVGEPKSGTTALAEFLTQHPDIFISTPKEPAFFASDLISEAVKHSKKNAQYYKYKTIDDYKKLFKDSSSKQLKGDASTVYLYSKEAAKNIHTHNPKAKIIVMLRNPISFLHSLHMQYVNEKIEDETDFSKALSLEKKRKKGQSLPANVPAPSLLYYSERVKYADHIKRYMDLFPSQQILVITQEEFKSDNKAAFSKVLSFLDRSEVDVNFGIVHGSVKPKNKYVHSLAHAKIIKGSFHAVLGPARYDTLQKKVRKVIMKPTERVEIDQATKQKVSDLTRDEIKKVSDLLKRNLATVWGNKK